MNAVTRSFEPDAVRTADSGHSALVGLSAGHVQPDPAGEANCTGDPPDTASCVTVGVPAGAQAAVLLTKYFSWLAAFTSLLSPKSQRTDPSRSSTLTPASRSMSRSG